MLDLGTGTGCLLLAALSEFPDRVRRRRRSLADAEPSWPRRNAAMLGMADARSVSLCRLGRRAGRALRSCPVQSALHPHGQIDGLMPEVAGYEPRIALDGGRGRVFGLSSAASRSCPVAGARPASPCWNSAPVRRHGRPIGSAGAGFATRAAPRFVRNRACPGAPPGQSMKKPFGRADDGSLASFRQGQPHSGLPVAAWPNRSAFAFNGRWSTGRVLAGTNADG